MARLLAPYRAEWTAVGVHLGAKMVIVVLVIWGLGGAGSMADRFAFAWDGGHFIARIRDGYQAAPDFAFAPLYPWLARAAGGTATAMLLVANVAGAAAVFAIARLMGFRAAVFFGVFPTWLVYSTVGYSESVFVLAAALALLAARQARVWTQGVAAGLLSGVAVLGRYAGVFGFAGVGLWLLRTRPVAAGYAAATAVFGAAVLAWHRSATGDAFVYLEAQKGWGAELAWPWEQVDFILHGWLTNQPAFLAAGHPSLVLWRNAIFWALAVWGVWRLWHRGQWLLLAFSLPLVVLVVCTVGTPAFSLPRLVLAAFPAIAVHGASLVQRDAVVAYGVMATLAATWILGQHLDGRFFA